jgi:hypothetical protein
VFSADQWSDWEVQGSRSCPLLSDWSWHHW